jgi:3-hydroxybutyrate dehydrogenase
MPELDEKRRRDFPLFTHRKNMLRDHVAVITGSTSGIGLALANAFAAAGCHLAINGFAPSGEAQALVQRLEREHQVRVMYHPADLADPEQCVSLIEDARKLFGRVDILINNAGIQHVAPVETFPSERWDAIIAINLSASFHTIRTALPGMQQRSHGRIVNIASVHGLVASMHKAAYVAAKHGILGLTKVVALENATRGITCNTICPGFVLTPLVQKQIDDRAAQSHVSEAEAAQQFLREKQPSEQFTKVEEIAALALFLCSNEGANITGTSFPIDGGWTAQ